MNFAPEILDFLQTHWVNVIVGVFILGLFLHFLWEFIRPAGKLKKELSTAATALEKIRSTLNGKPLDDLTQVEKDIGQSETLKSLWKEYEKTLHKQEKDGRIERWRSTALAETFFTEQALVDSPLQTDYFKHLPGLLTGLGIIGTFGGLIKGLTNFTVSTNPEVSQAQLQGLIGTVGHAFYVSAAAIGLAMLCTWFEKFIVTRRYRQVEVLREQIDRLFASGAGEEYLERLVTASETSATQAAQLKDSLVGDLKEVLQHLTKQQIEAQRQNTGQMSEDVGRALAQALEEPMREITKVTQTLGANQGDTINTLLTDVLTSFSEKMEKMFGGQMQGLTTMMERASAQMEDAATQFGQLAANMDAAGTSTVDAMGAKLTSALDAMESRQSAMNTQMNAFVGQLSELVAQQQSESQTKLQETLAAMAGQVSSVVEQLRVQAEAAAESHGERTQRLEGATSQMMGALSGQVEQLLAQSMQTNKTLQATVANLAGATDKAMSSMNAGADTLALAANDFAKAGQGVANTMSASSEATQAIQGASTQLVQSTKNTQSIMAGYERTNAAFATMLTDLKTTMDTAKRDAQMTSTLIAQIEAATQQLVQAQKEADSYLQSVNDVLTKAHDSFSENINDTLSRSNSGFQKELSTAVGILSGAIKELGEMVDKELGEMDKLIPARRG